MGSTSCNSSCEILSLTSFQSSASSFWTQLHFAASDASSCSFFFFVLFSSFNRSSKSFTNLVKILLSHLQIFAQPITHYPNLFMPTPFQGCKANKNFLQEGQQNIFFTLATQKSHCPQKFSDNSFRGQLRQSIQEFIHKDPPTSHRENCTIFKGTLGQRTVSCNDYSKIKL